MLRPFLPAFASSLMLLTACQLAPPEPAPTACDCNSQTYLEGGTLFTQASAEYRALCVQAYRLAANRVERNSDGATAPLAVVLDLDETVLDNSPYTAWQVVTGNPYTPDTWTQWVSQASAEAVPGAAEFLHRADELGVALFYISNRDTSHLEATMQNMRDLGLPQVSADHFLLKTHTSDKTERRDSVRAMGYEITLLVGDNLGDFEGQYDKPATNAARREAAEAQSALFGEKYIVLPNALYGTWEGALYGYDRSLSDEDRCALRAQAMRPASL